MQLAITVGQVGTGSLYFIFTLGKIHETSYAIYLLKNFPSAIPSIWFMFSFWIGALTVQNCLCRKAVTDVWERARVREWKKVCICVWECRGKSVSSVCRCPCSLRHEDPACSVNSSGEYIYVIFKNSWLRNLCTICEHIPFREMLQKHIWFLR